MKNFYPKSKGKIHPSPSSSTPRTETLAALQLLPIAILSLTSSLGNDDKEVLAYLILRCLDERAKSGEFHTKTFACGCFDCYTRFWSRWDCSPDRDLIHRAIDAFEDHLNDSQRARGKRRNVSEKGKKKGKEREKVADEIVEGNKMISEEEAGDVICEEAGKGDREEVVVNEEVVVGGERRKGWADVTAIFNSRLWSLWSPGD